MIHRTQLAAGRAAACLSQAQLATAAGLSTMCVTRIELGQTAPRPRTTEKLVAALARHGVTFATDADGVLLVRIAVSQNVAREA